MESKAVTYILRLTFHQSCEGFFEQDQNNKSINFGNQHGHLIELSNLYESDLELNLLIKDIAHVIISLLNIILNITSFLVFFKWKKSPMRIMLLYLTINEIGFNFAFWYESILIFMPKPQIWVKLLWLFYDLMWILCNGSLIMRNWALVLIAFARWEAIKYPLRPKKICDGKSLTFILILIGTISFTYGVIRIFEYRLVFCLDNSKIFLIEQLSVNHLYKILFLNVGFLVFQGFGPVLFVLNFSVALICQLRQSNPKSDSLSFKGSQIYDRGRPLTESAISRNSNLPSLHKPSDEFKNRSVLYLCAVFFILESPQCLCYTLFAFGFISEATHNTICHFTATLLLIDSLSNFFLYSASNRKFRSSLMALCSCTKLFCTRKSQPS